MRALPLAAIVCLACGTDPYGRYASAVHRDVGASSEALTRAEARLQLTIVHGRVPAESARVWVETLRRTSQELTHHADHLSGVSAPDSSFAQSQAALLDELHREADTLSAIAASMAEPTQVGGALGRLMRGVEYTQDELRWTRQRVARQVAVHGVQL